MEDRRKINYKYILFIISLIVISYRNQLTSFATSIIPKKIVNSYNITATINQNDIYSLPQKSTAYYSFGDKKSVNIKWVPAKIDTSIPGTKTAIGTINGYSRKILFTATVIPETSLNSISDCSTVNSLIKFTSQLPSDAKYVWFKTSKGLESKSSVVPVDNSTNSYKLYLPFGRGTYYIDILTGISTENNSTFYLWKSMSVINEDTRDLRFLLPGKNVESDSPKIVELATNIVSGLKTDMEKTRAIHDWVANNIAYDTKAYYKNDFRELSALETLQGKKAICSGYANLTAALNRAIGIPTKVVGGTAWDSSKKANSNPSGHAWNESYVDGTWIAEDTTWDAGAIDSYSKKFHFDLSHKYFNPNMSKFTDDHLKTSEE